MTAPRDGTFELYYRDGWAYLRVTPPDAGGQPVYHEDVENRMRLLGVPRVSASTIRALVREASGQAVALVEWPGGERLAAVVSAGVSDDELEAWVSVTPPRKGGAPPRVEDLTRALGAAGVVEGIDDEALRSVVANERYDERVVVARGREPIDARSARIIYHFDPHRGRPYLVMEFDRINLRELNFIENRHTGDVLAELEPPTAPRDGVTVFGRVLPANRETQEIALTAGTNTEKSADGTRIVATADGNVRIEKGAIVVEPVVRVESVDYSTGNIHFEGSVVVEKDVADGFVVEADGDVQVGRGVGRATIRAGGNVLLQSGINGGGSGVIECRGNLFTKYIESSAVESHGNVFVEEAIMHSRLSVWKHCVLNGRRSEIIASNLVVGGSLWCKKLGSFTEAPVLVSMGIDPQMLAAFRDARRDCTATEERLDELKHQLEQLEHLAHEGRADQKVLDARAQVSAELGEVREHLPRARHRFHELRENLQASRESRLVVEDSMFKGAVVLFGTFEYHAPEKGARKTVLRRGVYGVEEEGFNPSEPPKIDFDPSPEAGATSESGRAPGAP